MVFYRYLNLQYGLEALQTSEWKVGRLSKLNDIFDCRPRLINPPKGTDSLEDVYLDELGEMLGLLCYAAVDNDPVVWAHYGDLHRGIALGFEFAEGDPDFPHKVTYDEERPVLDLSEVGTAPEDREPNAALKRLIDAGFTTKHPSWIYEQEYRHFVPLNGCRMKGEHYFRPILWNKLKMIVLGAKCSATMRDIDRIVTMHHGEEYKRSQNIGLRRPEIRKCRTNPETYKLAFDVFPQTPSGYSG